MPEAAPLKLMALDAEDLEVISATVQDAVTAVGDIAWLPDERRFVLLLNRFVWESVVPEQESERVFERRRAALHFERVEAVQRRRIAQERDDAVLNLLAIRYTADEAPAGVIDLIFSSDAVIRLRVECIEARLCDLGPSWQTDSVPQHALEDTPGEP